MGRFWPQNWETSNFIFLNLPVLIGILDRKSHHAVGQRNISPFNFALLDIFVWQGRVIMNQTSLQRRQMPFWASRITGQLGVCLTVCSDWQQRNIKGLRYCTFEWGIHRVTAGFPAQRGSNAENVSIWWRNNVDKRFVVCCTCHDVINYCGPHTMRRGVLCC